MNPRYKPLLLAGGAIVVGAALLLAVRLSSGKHAEQGNAVTAAAGAAVADANAEPANDDQHAARENFPWEQANTAQPQNVPAVPGSRPTDTLRPPPAMSTEAVALMQAQIVRSSMHADTLMQKLDELESTGKMPKEVDIGALRGNLLIAKRAQTLAAEMLLLNQQEATPARDQRVQAIILELQQLQSRIRVDVGQSLAAKYAAPVEQ